MNTVKFVEYRGKIFDFEDVTTPVQQWMIIKNSHVPNINCLVKVLEASQKYKCTYSDEIMSLIQTLRLF